MACSLSRSSVGASDDGERLEPRLLRAIENHDLLEDQLPPFLRRRRRYPYRTVGSALLRNFAVKSHEGKEQLLSSEDITWRVWRFRKPLWGMKKREHGEIEAEEECKEPPAEVSDKPL
ncbi:hypothetical protein BU16DRAFT_568060 [Lophium mytilinum]|uniref:Uncharacterized protein n=1 Tax=Lophium mytilinum TaxID=390894 RepID=A0A6A6Q8Z4_9PEZI|nr:hypothetical protein BU16DRAFT_568060 [Lophium mytilinum]